jgi:hypothetical protein
VRKFRLRGIRVTPSLVVSMIALLIALSGTGIAATVVPLAKRALSADKAKVATNALKLNGQTATQIAAIPGPATDATTLNGQTAAQIAATPGPTSTLAGSLFTIRLFPWSVNLKGDKTDARALCNVGEKVVGGGFDIASGIPVIMYNRPLADGSGWWVQAYQAAEDTSPSNGTAWAVCAKVS